MSYWNYIVILLCLGLLLFLLWKEVQRKNKTLLAARIVASMVAVAALACLGLPVYSSKTEKGIGSKAVLLTEGFDRDSVQQFLAAAKNVPLFTTDKTVKSFNAAYITDAGVLANQPGYQQIHLFGWGLREGELSAFHNGQLIFHPSPIKTGITAIGWTQKLRSGEPLLVQGSVTNATSRPLTLVLSGFDTVLDTFSIATKGQHDFELTTVPKGSDKAVYTLSLLAGKDTLEKNPVPVEVIPPQPLKVLILAASPDFENKFLKNWLAQNNYEVILRTAISKDKWDKKFLNTAQTSVEPVTYSLLQKMDVVIADASELAANNASELAALQASVEEGLGLVVKEDSAANSGLFYARPFPLTQVRDSTVHQLQLHFADSSSASIQTGQPLFIKPVAGTQSLVKDAQSRIIVSSKLAGGGTIICTTLGNTYTWQLSGNKAPYNALWSLLLQKAARKISAEEAWTISPFLPLKDEPVTIQIATSKNAPQMQSGESFMYLQQHPQLSFLWKGTYWPAATGWHPLVNNNGSPASFYVYDKEDWKAVRASQRLAGTKNYVQHHPHQPADDAVEVSEVKTEVPKIYFFILTLLCAGFLWAEKK